MTYHTIALDLDGTLLTDNKQILAESLDVLAQARQQGVNVLIVTGRHHIAIKPFYHALELNTPAICCNGSYIYDFANQQVSTSNPLTKPQTKRIVELLDQYNIHSLMYVDDAMTYEKADDNIRRWHLWSDRQPEALRPNLIQVDNFTQTAEQVQNVWKFAATSSDDKLHALSTQLETEMNLNCEFSWHNQMDIVQTGNNKGNMLQKWVESQGLSMANVIAFGDNFNDISMLKMAGLGVAMGNSADDIKASANLITSDNESPGIANVIRQYVL